MIDRLAEERIRQAQEAGAFDDLPGAGEPLPAEEAPLVPEALRVAYRILRNSGHLPPEVTLRKEIREVESLIAQAVSVETRRHAVRRLELLRWQLSRGPRARGLRIDEAYQERVQERLGAGRMHASLKGS